MCEFVVRFCARYQLAVDDRARCVAPWRLAFAAAESSPRPVIRNLLLGASAHMSYDLCAVIVDMLSHETDAEDFRHDVLAINRVIDAGIAPVQRSLAAFSPYAGMLAGVGGGLDDLVTWRTFAHWRQGAWADAIAIRSGALTLPDVERRATRRGASLRPLPL